MTKSELDLLIKVSLGAVIFAFSLALAYFSADALAADSREASYGLVLLGFGMAYVVVGIIVAHVFPISLGLLFAADVLLLHIFSKSFTGFVALLKAVIVGLALVALYTIALTQLKDREEGKTKAAPAQK